MEALKRRPGIRTGRRQLEAASMTGKVAKEDAARRRTPEAAAVWHRSDHGLAGADVSGAAGKWEWRCHRVSAVGGEERERDERRRDIAKELSTTMQRARRRVMCVGRVCECECVSDSGDE